MKNYSRVYIGSDRRRVHNVIAERALGKPLPPGAHVHHADGNRWNNAPSNLVICQNTAYHSLLHRRMRVLKLGGDPNTQAFCSGCKRLHSISEFYRAKPPESHVRTPCKECWKARDRARDARTGRSHHRASHAQV